MSFRCCSCGRPASASRHGTTTLCTVYRRALTWACASVVIFEPTLKSDEFEGIPVVADLDEFKRSSDLIVANRMEPCLSDSADKVYTRDLYFRD